MNKNTRCPFLGNKHQTLLIIVILFAVTMKVASIIDQNRLLFPNNLRNLGEGNLRVLGLSDINDGK